ncbi:MAG: DinB family protein [Gemmatimonadaceae bacterium]
MTAKPQARQEPEVWLRGPVPGIAPLLQPVAHALLQAREDVHRVVTPLANDALWARPEGAASVGFHVRHAAGSLDRLFTYARGEALSEAQRAALVRETAPEEQGNASAAELVGAFEAQVERALAQLRGTAEDRLTEPREVGRARLPSTVLGLLFHAAEHTQRHVGQTITTAKVVEGIR